MLTAPQELSATVDLVAAAATSLASLNDAAGEAKAHFVHALALSRLGRVGACETSLDQALAAARRAGDRRRANTVLAIAPLAALWGPSPVTRASGRCLDVVRVLRITQGAPAVEAVALSCQGVLEALRGRTEAAHRMIASGRKMVEELGIAQRLFETDVFAGFVALLEGDVSAAEQTLRGAYDGLRDLGLGIDAARAAALLGRALLAQHRSEEAEALSHESEALAGDDLKAAIAWRGVRAEALARRGEHDAAIELAKAGVEIAAATDALLDHADARRALAAALRAARRGEMADAEDRHAIELWEAKGATLLAERAQQHATKPVRPDRGVDLPADKPPAFDPPSGLRTGSAQGRPDPLLASDVRLSRLEFFDVRDEARALARFEEVTAAPDGRLPSRGLARRRVGANRASGTWDRHVAAVNTRDAVALEATLSDRLVWVHHPTGTTFGKPETMATWLGAFQAEKFAYETEVLATLGESLALVREWASVYGLAGEGFKDFGPARMDTLIVVEDLGTGFHRGEELAQDRLGQAIVRLYELYGAQQSAGPARTRLEAAAQAISTIDGPVDPERMTGAYAPNLRLADHRVLATWSCESAAELMNNFRHQFDLAPDFAARIDDVLLLETDALLARVTYFGTSRDSGGAFENRICVLYRFGDDGRIGWIDCYEAEHEAEALARFDELTSDRPPLPRPVLSNVEGGDHRGIDAPKERGDLAAFFANSAVRAMRRVVVAQTARDIEAIAATFADDFRGSDRRSLLRADTTREEYLEAYRSIVDMTSEPPVGTVMATRGARLALVRWLWRGAGGDVGPSEIEMLHVIEVDDRGDHVAVVTFDATDVDAAYAELDARYEAGEAATPSNNWLSISGFVRAVERRDWDAVRALCRDDFVEHDHRGLAVLGGTGGADAWVDNFRTLVELAPDTVYRAHHVLEAERGYFVHGSWYGTREGGPYELQVNAVLELDDEGRFRRADMYDDTVADAAFARLAGLAAEPNRLVPSPPREAGSPSSPPLPASGKERGRDSAPRYKPPPNPLLGKEGGHPPRVPPNAAMRAMTDWFDAYSRAFTSGDWEEVRRACHPSFLFDDRRRMALLRGSLDLLIASARERAAVGARPEWRPVGFFGDRVCIDRVLWAGSPSDGPFEIEDLGVIECDEKGHATAFVLFDLDDARLAQREAWARWAAIDPNIAAVVTPVGDIVDAFNEKSAAKWRAAFADDLVVEDYRLAGMGHIEGADAYTESVVALWTLAPVTHADLGWQWLALDRHGAITTARRTGTVPDGGGDFENEYLYLYLVSQGRITHVELFEMNALDKALARFEELRPPSLEGEGDRPPSPRPAPLLVEEGGHALPIPPNQAIRATERLDQAFLANDLPAIRALFHPEFVFEDRGKKALVKGDVETLIESGQYLLSLPAVHLELARLATIGDRITLQHEHWSNRGDGDAFAIDRVRLVEIDVNGLFRAWILFDSEDRKSAFAEAQERFVAGEAASCGAQALLNELHIAWGNQDWEALSALIADDAVIDDYRQLGLGRLGRDGWIESWRVGADLAPDVRLELLRILVWNEHGRVQLSRACGTRDGGEFENVLLNLFVHDGGLLRFHEFYDVGDAERAVARFEQLCAALEP